MFIRLTIQLVTYYFSAWQYVDKRRNWYHCNLKRW